MLVFLMPRTAFLMSNLPPFLKQLPLVLFAVLAPIHTMMAVVGFLIFADLVLGIWAAVKRGEAIQSSAMRRTVSKILVYQLAIISGFLCETYLIGGLIPISKLVAGVIGMVEMKSILENANGINGEPIFKSLIQKLGSDNDKNKEQG
jgi:hypothetical protein